MLIPPKLELAAVMLGTLPDTRVGLLTTVVDVVGAVVLEFGFGGTKDDCVAMDDVLLDRVGEEGRADATKALVDMGGGEGAIDMGFDGVLWWALLPLFALLLGKGEAGATVDVGVGKGVFCDDKECE